MEPKFMISEVFGTSWKYTKSQIWVLVGLFIGYFILSMIISIFGMPAQGSMVGKVIVYLISAAISSAFMLGYIKNLFQTMDGEEPQFSAYGQQSRKIVTYFIASLIMGIVVTIGTFLLIVPGIYLGIRLQFYAAYIVEEDCGIIESLQKSWNLTQGQVMPLFLLILAMIGIAIIGCILFFVGLFVAAPLIYMMQCYTFRKLNTISTEEVRQL
ncbi:hypothetical protein [Parabacteroides hominis]|jgi:membrane-anchored glycerophosphoryl diester phosphodiesterase (GDPDase)|uniref:DUF7847 domain-containing protein n=1 Tax=Parabacteroides hominis TaxID=2763057 RepID=A0ABR7DKP1_9BACT|nr:hypothetical protein [Parabacteroides hominis]MBC5631994.1 hypothetical protein [Parabacteroides hominis]MBD9168272.1 hypothetical protein [Parabacteroides johnsonii]